MGPRKGLLSAASRSTPALSALREIASNAKLPGDLAQRLAAFIRQAQGFFLELTRKLLSLPAHGHLQPERYFRLDLVSTEPGEVQSEKIR